MLIPVLAAAAFVGHVVLNLFLVSPIEEVDGAVGALSDAVAFGSYLLAPALFVWVFVRGGKLKAAPGAATPGPLLLFAGLFLSYLVAYPVLHGYPELPSTLALSLAIWPFLAILGAIGVQRYWNNRHPALTILVGPPLGILWALHLYLVWDWSVPPEALLVFYGLPAMPGFAVLAYCVVLSLAGPSRHRVANPHRPDPYQETEPAIVAYPEDSEHGPTFQKDPRRTFEAVDRGKKP